VLRPWRPLQPWGPQLSFRSKTTCVASSLQVLAVGETSAAAPADPAPIPEVSSPLLEGTPATDDISSDPTPIPKEPAPVSEEAAPAVNEAPTDPAPVFEEPIPVVPATKETPADPSPVPEELAHVTEAAAPIDEIQDLVPDKPDPAPEQSVPSPVGAPAPDDPAPVHEEDGPAASAPPAENLATAENAVPTADETGEEGLPTPEPAAAVAVEDASVTEEPGFGLEGTVEAEPIDKESLPAGEDAHEPASALSETNGAADTTSTEGKLESESEPEPVVDAEEVANAT